MGAVPFQDAKWSRLEHHGAVEVMAVEAFAGVVDGRCAVSRDVDQVALRRLCRVQQCMGQAHPATHRGTDHQRAPKKSSRTAETEHGPDGEGQQESDGELSEDEQRVVGVQAVGNGEQRHREHDSGKEAAPDSGHDSQQPSVMFAHEDCAQRDRRHEDEPENEPCRHRERLFLGHASEIPSRAHQHDEPREANEERPPCSHS